MSNTNKKMLIPTISSITKLIELFFFILRYSKYNKSYYMINSRVSMWSNVNNMTDLRHMNYKYAYSAIYFIKEMDHIFVTDIYNFNADNLINMIKSYFQYRKYQYPEIEDFELYEYRNFSLTNKYFAFRETIRYMIDQKL